MHKRAFCFLLAAALCVFAPLAFALVNGTATILIFPSAGELFDDRLTCVYREGGTARPAMPESMDQALGCLRVDVADVLDLETLESIRYYGPEQSEGILLRNQLTAFRYDSAGVVEIVIEEIPANVTRTSLEIVGFTMIELNEPLKAGDVLYLFYGVGEPTVTLAGSVIMEGERVELLREAVDANLLEPQPFSAGEGDQAASVTAKIIPMEEFIAEAPEIKGEPPSVVPE